MDLGLVVLAASPILLIVLLLLFRVKLLVSALFTLCYTILFAIFIWQMRVDVLLGSVLKGLFVGIDIGLIIGGALLFVAFFTQTGKMQVLSNVLSHISVDKRVQLVFLAWFFVAFIEGTAGFGTPAAVVVPLLIGIGISPVPAIVIALVSNGFSAAFGAVGTPVLIGFSTIGIDVTVYGALLLGVLSVFAPLLLLMLYELSLKNRRFSHVREMIGFSLWCGIVYGASVFGLSFFGPEFPTLFGALVSMIVVFITTKLGWFVPTRKTVHHVKKSVIALKDIRQALLPYGVFIVLLFIGKFYFPKFSVSIVEPITHTFSLANPGILFLLVLVFFSLKHSKNWNVSDSLKRVFARIGKPFIAIFSLSAFVQIMVFSGQNVSGNASMILLFSQLLVGPVYFLISPFIGSLGSFASGSTTVSNLLFGEAQLQAAELVGFSGIIALAMQLVGASLGNMVSLTNIMAAQAVADVRDVEHKILKRTIVVCTGCLIVLGLLGLVLQTYFYP